MELHQLLIIQSLLFAFYSKEYSKDNQGYTDWSARDDIKANLQVDLILLLDEFGYPPVTIDDVYKEVLEQAENFKKYAN
ncbi:MAG: type I restriction enzyme endonuclease domain-containing protein [Blautia faecis]